MVLDTDNPKPQLQTKKQLEAHNKNQTDVPWLDDDWHEQEKHRKLMEEGGLGVEEMTHNDIALLKMLQYHPDTRRQSPSFRWREVAESAENKHSVRVGRVEEHKHIARSNHRETVEWWETGWKQMQCVCGKLMLPTRDPADGARRCGCQIAPKQRYDLKDQTFFKLTVTGYDAVSGLWECVCACGGTTKATTGRLRNGLVRNCGKCVQATGRPRANNVTTAAADDNSSGAGWGAGGYKMLNISAQHHAFLLLLKQETGMSMIELINVALEQYYGDEWAEYKGKA